MDLARFGLTRRPFRTTPDTGAYYPSATHETAAAALREAYSAHDGLALLDGEPGTGKTLVALRFLESLDDSITRIMLPAPRYTRPADLFQAILFDLGVDYHGLGEQELRLAVTGQLLTSLIGGGPTVMVIDEAQHLTADVLEELRLLGNLETRASKAAFIVLVALPALRERLKQPDAAVIAQRIAVRSRLEPFDASESVQYLRHRLQAAGCEAENALTDEALSILAAHGKGLPRLLNRAADLAMTLAIEAEADGVDAEAALEAIARLGLAVEEPAVLPHPAKPADEPPAKPRAARTRLPKRRSA